MITEFVQLAMNRQLEFRLPWAKRMPTAEEIAEAREQSWIDTRNQLLEGRDLSTFFDGTPTTSKVANLAKLLDNAWKELSYQERQHNQASNTATLSKIILPVIRRSFSELLINELVGVQAVSHSVENIHTLHVNDTTTPLSIQIIKEVAGSRTRKLAARWTFEAAEQSKSLPTKSMARGIGNVVDLEAEIMAALSLDISAEVDQEFLRYLRGLAGEPDEVFDMQTTDDLKPSFVGDVHSCLAIQINRQAIKIAKDTRRGAGNKIVVSPTALTILASASSSAFEPSTGFGRKPFVGTLTNSNVYVDEYAPDNAPVLIGYKGNEIDAGVFYAPFNLLLSSGVVIDPITFDPVITFLTRYGVVENKNPSNYYKSVGINTDTLSFH